MISIWKWLADVQLAMRKWNLCQKPVVAYPYKPTDQSWLEWATYLVLLIVQWWFQGAGAINHKWQVETEGIPQWGICKSSYEDIGKRSIGCDYQWTNPKIQFKVDIKNINSGTKLAKTSWKFARINDFLCFFMIFMKRPDPLFINHSKHKIINHNLEEIFILIDSNHTSSKV